MSLFGRSRGNNIEVEDCSINPVSNSILDITGRPTVEYKMTVRTAR